MYLHMDEDTGMIAASQERERTKQAALAHQSDALIWRELEHPATSSDRHLGPVEPAHPPRSL